MGERTSRITGRRIRLAGMAAAATIVLLFAAHLAGLSLAATSDTLGRTTVQQRIVPADPGSDFSTLTLGPGEPYVVREDGVGRARPGRDSRRTSLAYFAQLSDFQLADEESPARVEFVDPVGPPVDAAWRPWEAL